MLYRSPDTYIHTYLQYSSVCVLDGEGNFSLATLPGTSLQNPSHSNFLAKGSLQMHRDDLFGHQDTPSSSISPFSPSLGTDDFPG